MDVSDCKSDLGVLRRHCVDPKVIRVALSHASGELAVQRSGSM